MPSHTSIDTVLDDITAWMQLPKMPRMRTGIILDIQQKTKVHEWQYGLGQSFREEKIDPLKVYRQLRSWSDTAALLWLDIAMKCAPLDWDMSNMGVGRIVWMRDMVFKRALCHYEYSWTDYSDLLAYTQHHTHAQNALVAHILFSESVYKSSWWNHVDLPQSEQFMGTVALYAILRAYDSDEVANRWLLQALEAQYPERMNETLRYLTIARTLHGEKRGAGGSDNDLYMSIIGQIQHTKMPDELTLPRAIGM